MDRFALAAVAFALFASPVVADPAGAAPNDTIQAILAHGDAIDVDGMSYDLTFKPDGAFSSGEFAGTYHTDSDKLCVTIEGIVSNQCTAYPACKKSGDSFTVQADMGPYTVTIH